MARNRMKSWVKTNPDKLEQYVQRGERWLDKQDPLWFQKIDLAILDMGDGLDCIIGQLFGNYSDAVLQGQITATQAVRGGFAVQFRHPRTDIARMRAGLRRQIALHQLTALWEQRIEARRAEYAAAEEKGA